MRKQHFFEIKKFIYLSFMFSLLLTCYSAAENNELEEVKLEEIFNSLCNTPSDLNEHLPILRQLAQQSSSVTEISRSHASLWGILQGLSESFYQQRNYLGINFHYPPLDVLNLAKKCAKKRSINFTFWRVNDLHIEIEPTDMLFLDGLHTYCHLTHELETFGPKIKKFICMHDTSYPWGDHEDSIYSGDYSEYPASYDRTKQGLWPAIIDFLERHPEWQLFARYLNNYGLTILARKNTINCHVLDDATVKKYLNHKVVLCTGPSLRRYEMLKNTVEEEMWLIPFKKIFIVTNDPQIENNITFNNVKPICKLIPERGHQLDCLNCIIDNLKQVISDPEILDDDIILFKHESVFINDMELIKKAISTLLNGYDMVVRNRSWSGAATDVFFVKVSAIREIANNLSTVTEFPSFAPFCELYFTHYIVNHVRRVYSISYEHSGWGPNELGFYHRPRSGDILPPWNKENRDKLFK